MSSNCIHRLETKAMRQSAAVCPTQEAPKIRRRGWSFWASRTPCRPAWAGEVCGWAQGNLDTLQRCLGHPRFAAVSPRRFEMSNTELISGHLRSCPVVLLAADRHLLLLTSSRKSPLSHSTRAQDHFHSARHRWYGVDHTLGDSRLACSNPFY